MLAGSALYGARFMTGGMATVAGAAGIVRMIPVAGAVRTLTLIFIFAVVMLGERDAAEEHGGNRH